MRSRSCGTGGGRGQGPTAGAKDDRRTRHLRTCRRGPGSMTVHFIGAGPGAADLITVRGRDLLSRCPVCIYAGSVVPPELLAHCPPGARVIDSAPLSLDRLEQLYVEMHAAGLDVAR